MTDSAILGRSGKRVYPLDALRGTAILLMVLASLLPFGVLPSWMYHAQSPPPSHQFNPDLPGITWVDTVFPFFIFSMGAAFPLALSRRIANGRSNAQMIWPIIKRGFALLGFAIYNYHMTPSKMVFKSQNVAWVLGLVGFFLMFPMWGRLPWKLDKFKSNILKYGSWVLAACIISVLKYNNGQGFSPFKSNIILLVLADLSVFGAFIWLFTRENILLRLGLLGILFAIRLSCTVDTSWINSVGNTFEIPFLAGLIKNLISQEKLEYVKWIYNFSWMFQWRFLKYLFIIIPATIIGDLLVVWMNKDENDHLRKGWGKIRLAAIVCIMLGFILIVLVGLKVRLCLATFLCCAGMGITGLFFVRNPQSNRERLLNRMYLWGIFWLILGLLFEPYEGGIKKDPSTMSYYFVMSGLATFLLIAFSITIDIFRKRKYLKLLINNGQNPMIAYVSNSNLLIPVLALTGLRPIVNSIYSNQPWLGFVIAVGLTLVIASIVSLFTHNKIFLRT